MTTNVIDFFYLILSDKIVNPVTESCVTVICEPSGITWTSFLNISDVPGNCLPFLDCNKSFLKIINLKKVSTFESL